MRNRVVHSGYLPTQPEAATSLEALIALEKFIGDRLADRLKAYPKTAILFLGEEGLRRRTRWASAKRWLDGEENSIDPADWIAEYTEWRETVNSSVVRRRQQT
jgi:hypothetical protein